MLVATFRMVARWGFGLTALVAVMLVLLLATDIAADVVLRGH
ncbi:MAG: hypothetical protein P8N02_16145 [Actinomycetota bacterium]|jgi:hypothetical protein|nr:hypothetical protein [Actinomycetota bacterium]